MVDIFFSTYPADAAYASTRLRKNTMHRPPHHLILTKTLLPKIIACIADGENVQKGYLQGRYSAIPFFAPIATPNWQNYEKA